MSAAASSFSGPVSSAASGGDSPPPSLRRNRGEDRTQSGMGGILPHQEVPGGLPPLGTMSKGPSSGLHSAGDYGTPAQWAWS